jgi:hypothetical protein
MVARIIDVAILNAMKNLKCAKKQIPHCVQNDNMPYWSDITGIVDYHEDNAVSDDSGGRL